MSIYRQTDRRRLVFVDQSGFNRFNFHAKYGRAPRGQCCFSKMQPNKGKRITATGFLCWDANRSPFFYALTDGHGDFDGWVEVVYKACECNFLRQGDILVVDNWSGFVGANTGAVLAEMLEPLGISIWPLPKYSPELNPIELLWNYIKGICCGCPIPENDDETFTLLSDLFNDVINVQQFITHVDKFICQGA